MQYRWLITALLLILISSTPALPQKKQDYTVKNRKAIRYFEESTSFYLMKNFRKAMPLLLNAVDKEPEFTEALLRIADIYQQLGDGQRSLAYLEQAVSLQKGNPEFVVAHFDLAKQYFSSGQYGRAEQLLEIVESFPQLPPQVDQETGRLLENIDFTRQAISNPLNFKPRALPDVVNRMPLQYFPVLTADQQQLFFTGRMGIGPQYDEDIYVCERDSKGRWKPPVGISGKINTEQNEGTCTIAADGRTIIFTSCQGRNTLGSCDLYISRKVGDQWTEVENLGPKVNTKFWESQPSLSADGNTLYFVSDKPNGYGKRDIYVTRRDEEGNWSQAENLGADINTRFDEISPYIHVNGKTLYFASNGRKGFGGMDLFSAEKTGSATWSLPLNLGYPLNDSDDQVSLFISSDGKTGYYANEKSRYTPYHRSELYAFNVPEKIRIEFISSYVKGHVYDAKTREPLAAAIELIDVNTEKNMSRIRSDSVNGEYLMVLTRGATYALYVNREGYLFRSLTFDFNRDESGNFSPVEKDIYLDPIETGKETVLNNIFFETDKYKIQPTSYPELNKVVSFLDNNPELKIKINGHTDDVGNEAYNLTLSENRAKAVYSFLIGKGIAENRLDYEGFGEKKPLEENSNKENRSQNRRIAFEIINAIR
jgi:OmpA-OmpF porin, OOP family